MLLTILAILFLLLTGNISTMKPIHPVTIYRPEFTNIDLECNTRPAPDQKDIVFCGAAAFTRIYGWETFSHDLVAGSHVSHGVYYSGYDCRETDTQVGNTGTFVWYDGKWKILLGGAEDEKRKAAEHGGMAFSEEMIIHNHQYFHNQLTERYRDKEGAYRVIADMEGELVIAEADSLTFGEFVEQLLNLSIREALFIDMGSVRYSFVRRNGVLQELYPEAKDFKYATNWIVFYKKQE